jgi:DNA phosphorothioation-associated DGQHR protein 1
MEINKNKTAYIETHALKVRQPLGDFYVISITARQLLEISFVEPMKYVDNSGNVKGSQREKDPKRLKEIAKYIESVEMAFPNSIILAANFTEKGTVSKDNSERWQIVEDKACGIYKILIPKKVKLAAIIDGQHRLKAFEQVNKEERFTELELLCSVYFDLPASYQAFLFATINSNQKKVDRSLALDQFGYNVEDEPEKAWTPEKYAVFISRRLNIDKSNSPLYQHIKVAPLSVDKLFAEGLIETWVVSTATIVDGICGLITSNPKRDRIIMQQKSFLTGRNRDMIEDVKDTSPLREMFINGMDKTIYNTLIAYFNSVNNFLWNTENKKSYIIKTVGVQALFDLLKLILKANPNVEPDKINFDNYLRQVTHIDFSDKFYQASGIGRSRIKNTIGLATGLISKQKIKKNDVSFYDEILSGKATNIESDKWVWDEEAENAVIYALEKAEWNYDSQTISLYLADDYEKTTQFNSYQSFFDKLVEIAETAFSLYLPSDHEFAEEQLEKFDSGNLVESHLSEYEENLKKLSWI